MAERLVKKDWRVVGYDLQPTAREAAKKAGVEVARSSAEAAQATERVMLSLPTSGVAASVIDELLPVLKTGQVVIDTTTGVPDEMIALGQRLAAAGIGYVDATIAGSSAQARTGQVLVLVGGETETVAKVHDVLASLAGEVVHVGPCGAGAKAKLVHNLVLGLNRAVLAEGLSLARSLGLDVAQMLAALRASPAASRVMETKGERMLRGRFEPDARLSQHHKDVQLILAAAQASGARVPLSTLHDRLLAEAEAAGFGELDNSAIIRVFEAAPEDDYRE
jgi:3-hydroxyisobutyrate dehydrogenase-like beta-hydroxyacid dehydrogenase